jgi:hypothetical protein
MSMPKKSPLDQICSTAEAAEIVGVSTKRLLVIGTAGRIEGKQLDGRTWVWLRSSVEAFARQERRSGPSAKND